MYPSVIFRVSVSLSNKEAIRATVTRVPCKINPNTVSTANNRRYKLDRMGKIEVIADSYSCTMLATVTMDETEISSLVHTMQEKLIKRLQDQAGLLSQMLSNAYGDVVITSKDWEV